MSSFKNKMTKTIDITMKLIDEPKFLKVKEGKVFAISDSKNTVMKVNALLQKGNDAKVMDSAMKLVLGDEAFQEIEDMNLSMSSYQAIFIGMMALITGKEFEEMDATFRGK